MTMETFHIVQIVYIFVIFFLTLLFILIPLKLIPFDQLQLSTRRSQRIVDFCNCFAGGVFLGTCFVQLIPYVEEKFHSAFVDGGLPVMYSPVLTQITVMLGFFLVLLMEQAVKTCQSGTQTKGAAGADVQEMGAVRSGYVITVSSSEESLGSNESDVELSREKKQMLRPKEKRKLKKVKAKHQGRNPDPVQSDHDHFAESNGGEKSARSSGEPAALSHAHVHLADLTKEEFGLRCVVLLFALSLHSLFEGMAIGLQEDLYKLINLAIGISVHECLVAFALGINLARQNLARSTVVKLCLLFSATIPLGIGIGMGVGGIHNFVTTLISAILQALTAGTFVYVIFVEILPSEIDRNRDRLLKVLVMFVGFCIISGLGFIMKDRH